MHTTWALLPVKSLQRAKSRLASQLQPQECAQLSRAMFLDVLAALEQAQHISTIAVLTNDADIAALAKAPGHLVIADPPDSTLCDNLNAAAQQIATLGATTLLVIPADIPTITAHDIDELLERHTSGLSLCPALPDGGTNALVCSPPAALPFQFGPDSARRHLETAAAHNLPAARIAMPAFCRDIDTPADLAWLAQQHSAGHTVQFLHDAGIAARITGQLGPGPVRATA